MTARGEQTSLRIEELAEATGATVRNIRVYQEKGLLPAPLRRGRTALYGPEHRRRLVLVLRLLDRGYTFATIDELFTAERVGLSLTELIEAENARAVRRPTHRKRRYSRADAEAVAGFEFSDRLIEISENGGLTSDGEGEDLFHTDSHMYGLFRELIQLGVESAEIDEIAARVFDGQHRAAEAMDILLDALERTDIEPRKRDERIESIILRSASAVRLIFLNVAMKRVREFRER